VKLRRVRVAHYGAFLDPFEVEFGAGLTLITGPSESGKSTLVDAVSLAVTGREVRGAKLARGRAEVVVEFDLGGVTPLRIEVDVNGDKAAVTGSYSAQKGTTHAPANRTGVEDLLSRFAGGAARWRRACIVSGQDRDPGLLAGTPATRRKAIEAILDFGRLEQARTRFAATRDQHAATVKRLDGVVARLTGVLEGLRSARPTPPDEVRPPPAFDIAQLNNAAAEQRRDTDRVAALKAALAGTSCPTCKRPLDSLSESDTTEYTNEIRVLESSITSRTLHLGTLRVQHQAYESASSAYRVYTGLKAAYDREVATYEDRMASTTFELSTAQHEAGAARALWSDAVLAWKLLGPEGCRNDVLACHVRGLAANATEVANALGLQGRLVADLGEAGDTLGFAFVQRGSSFDVDALSGGARRRLDIAVALAASAMAPEFRSSTLFFDDVFEGLDAESVEAVAEALVTTARTRDVVVVTQHPNLVSRLRQEGCRETAL